MSASGQAVPNVPGRCQVGGETVPEVCDLSPLSDGRLACWEHGLPIAQERARQAGWPIRFAGRWVKP